jgi:hypothetical protein
MRQSMRQGDSMQGPEQFATKGVNGTIFVRPDHIVIRRKRALLAIMSQGLKRTTEKELALDQVAGVQLKQATTFVNGYIRLSIAGQTEPAGGGLDAAQDEDAIMFTVKQQPGFEWAKELIDRHRAAAQAGDPTSPTTNG